jgi:hypothetical protein
MAHGLVWCLVCFVQLLEHIKPMSKQSTGILLYHSSPRASVIPRTHTHTRASLTSGWLGEMADPVVPVTMCVTAIKNNNYPSHPTNHATLLWHNRSSRNTHLSLVVEMANTIAPMTMCVTAMKNSR